MKRTIIAFSTAALIAAAPAALAQGVTSKAPGLQHKVSKKHHPRATPRCVRCKPRARRRAIRELPVTRLTNAVVFSTV